MQYYFWTPELNDRDRWNFLIISTLKSISIVSIRWSRYIKNKFFKLFPQKSESRKNNIDQEWQFQIWLFTLDPLSSDFHNFFLDMIWNEYIWSSNEKEFPDFTSCSWFKLRVSAPPYTVRQLFLDSVLPHLDVPCVCNDMSTWRCERSGKLEVRIYSVFIFS